MNRLILPVTVLFTLLITSNAASQTYNAVDWGTYFNDNTHYPDFNYQSDDYIDQVVSDKKDPESIYVVGKSFAAPSNCTLSVCSESHAMDLGKGDGFLAKYNECGELLWSTMIGDYASCLALDEEDGKTIIYVGGRASSGSSVAFNCDDSSIPVFQKNRADNSDGFVAKYVDNDTTVSLLRWTYFGGSFAVGSNATDDVFAIDVFKHTVFITGTTHSSNLFNGALHVGKTSYGGGGDAFLATFDSLLSSLIFFSYIGTQGNDRCHDIEAYQPASGPLQVFVSGTTSSSSGIASGSGFDQSYNGNTDLFLCKWEENGNGSFTQSWGTYLGGSSNEHGRQMQVDEEGNIFITGYGTSKDIQVTPFAYDTLFGTSTGKISGDDVYVYKISNSGSNNWCTYFGGNKDDIVNGLALLKNETGNYVIIAGLTKSPSNKFKLVAPVQNLLNGNDNVQYYDGFIAVLSDAVGAPQQLIFSTYLGGSYEDAVKPGQPHPFIALGTHNELYFVTPVKSPDINFVVGNAFQNLVHPYNGGSDGFIAKLIDITDTSQINCPILRTAGSDVIDTDNESNQLTLFPNPTQNKFTIYLRGESDEKTAIRIFNAYGKIIYNQDIRISAGENQIPVDLKDNPGGIYIISLRINGMVMMKRIIKL